MALITFSKALNERTDQLTGGRVSHGIALKLTQLAYANQGRNCNHAMFTATRRPCFDCGAHAEFMQRDVDMVGGFMLQNAEID